MWPPATSITIPSGSFRPSLTMVFKSEPSGFDERTRPAARSKKYKRPTVFAADFTVSHLERAFVRVERFRIHKESSDVVLSGDAVASEQFSRPRDRLAALGCREGFGKGCMRVRHLAFGLQLGHAHQEALRSGDVGEHLGQEVLHHLE